MQDERTHNQGHAFANFNPRNREGLVVADRRGMLKASLAGLAGLTLPALLRARAETAANGQPISSGKSVILLWMAATAVVRPPFDDTGRRSGRPRAVGRRAGDRDG